MASNMSTIGFVFADQDAFRSAMKDCAAAASKSLSCANGEYGIWQSKTGAEIWFHLGEADDGAVEILGLSPFFEGKSDLRLQITNAIQRANDSGFEGAFHGWVNPDQSGGGSYPIVFDAVDYAAREAGPFPALRHARIAAFSRDMAAFEDEPAFLASHASDDVKFAAQAFIPAGLFAAAQPAPETADSPPPGPQSTAFLTGKVLEHCLLRNEATGRDFHWLLVETLEKAVFDLVADPDIVKGKITEGGTIEATAVLFGRLLD